ncbi:MAG: hypothetical protein ACTHJM_06895 [Marmoricola sp.]
MNGFQGDGFSIEFEWKEVVHYWEGSHGYWFDAGWGASPPALNVPEPDKWDACVPEWMRGRRDVIVSRLVQHSGHTVIDSSTVDPEWSRTRMETRDVNVSS